MMYQKLVRDNIPAIIEKNGETSVTRKLSDKEYEDALTNKLQEEVAELLEAYTAKERSGGNGGCDGGPVRYGQDLRCFQEGSGTGQKPEGSREGDFLQENLLGFDWGGKERALTQQDEVRLIRKLIFAKNSQDLTHFYRCVDEIAEVLNKQGDKEGARAIRNTSRDGYVKSYYEASRQAQPLGSPFVSYKPAFVIDNKDIALWHAKNDNPPMRVRHILEYIENGEMVGKDVLEYDVSTDKWHRVEEECIELV